MNISKNNHNLTKLAQNIPEKAKGMIITKADLLKELTLAKLDHLLILIILIIRYGVLEYTLT